MWSTEQTSHAVCMFPLSLCVPYTVLCIIHSCRMLPSLILYVFVHTSWLYCCWWSYSVVILMHWMLGKCFADLLLHAPCTQQAVTLSSVLFMSWRLPMCVVSASGEAAEVPLEERFLLITAEVAVFQLHFCKGNINDRVLVLLCTNPFITCAHFCNAKCMYGNTCTSTLLKWSH